MFPSPGIPAHKHFTTHQIEEPLNTDYRQHVCNELQAASRAIADEWLTRLEPIVQEELRDIFPTEQYLDHIPSMIEEIGALLATPDENVNLLNSTISRKALELGSLRHQQQATVSQLLREYDILANVLEKFVRLTSDKYQGDTSIDDAIALTGAVNKVVRYILQCTVDAFTEKYMATIQEQTDKILSFNKFLGHELRTPLQSALLNTELLIESRDVLDPDTEDLLKIKSAIQSASSLISNIEQLIQSSDPTIIDSPVKQDIDLGGLVADITEQLSGELEARDMTLRCSGELGSVSTETGKLRLIMTNLITNSIKYSDPEKPDRVIEISRDDRPDQLIALSVWDNGLGIPADKIADVQGLRVRAHSELDVDNDVSGQGIGLYLVAEAVRDLEGSVLVEAEEGSYTRVTISLPNSVLE